MSHSTLSLGLSLHAESGGQVRIVCLSVRRGVEESLALSPNPHVPIEYTYFHFECMFPF